MRENTRIKYFVFAVIFIIAVTVRFYNIFNYDLVSDDALYSFRALGYFDFLAADTQSTPIQWFGEIPWWANLSFHDAPPLVFLIQKIFFLFFGDNIIAAKLPFIFFGLLSIFTFYLILRELELKPLFLYLGTFLYSVLAVNIWISQIGYLEGIEVFFIELSLYLFIKYIKNKKNKFIYLCMVALALAILCKYTAIFILPAFILYIILFDRKLLKNKKFYLSLIILLALLSPLIIYNTMTYITRGHFDAVVSSMFGIKAVDFQSISDRAVSLNLFNGIKVVAINFSGLFSLPIIFLLILAIFYQIYLLFKGKKIDNFTALFFISLVSCFLLLVMVGQSPRFFPIIVPFVVFILLITLSEWWQILKNKQAKIFFFIFTFILFIWEMLFSANFILNKKIINSNLFYPKDAIRQDYGLQNLDSYIIDNFKKNKYTLERPKNLNDIGKRKNQNAEKYGEVFMVDNSINWFAELWYELRYPTFYGMPFVMTGLEHLDQQRLETYITYLQSGGVDKIYYIYLVDESLLDNNKKDVRELSNYVVKYFQVNGALIDEIKNNSGKTIFNIYKL